jgi:hypothetical protein
MIVSLGTVAGILVVGLLAVIPFLLDYVASAAPRPVPVRVGAAAAGGRRRV